MRLFGSWYLVKDTGIPADYPAKARKELVHNRLKIVELEELISRQVDTIRILRTERARRNT